MSGVERALAGLFLLAAAAPAARLVVGRAFRRAFPRAAAAVASAVLLYAAVAVLAAVVLGPTPLRIGSSLVLAGLVVTVVLARPGRGRARRWPPGSLGFLRSIELLADREGLRKRAAVHGPVFKIRQYRYKVVCVVGLERAGSILRSHDESLSVPPLPFARLAPGRILRYMERDAHREHKAIVADAVPSEVGERWAAFLAREIRLALASASAASRADPRGLAPPETLRRLVRALLLRLFFGVEPRTPQAQQLEDLYGRLDLGVSTPRGLARTGRVLEEIRALLEARVETWSGNDAPPDSFLGTVFERSPDTARHPTTLDNLILMLATSNGDVAGLLAWLMVELGANPAWVERLREDAAHPALPRRVVLETLRLDQSEYLYRRIDRPITIDGYRVPAGWLMRICVSESHRDGAVFAAPDRFDPDRFAGRSPSAAEYSPFGTQRHLCLGRAITLEIGRLFVSELVRGYDWTVVEDGPPELGGRHWNHWRPSSRYRIRLEPRVPLDEPAPVPHSPARP